MGSQEVACIWDRRPAPAGTADPIPGCTDGDTAITGTAWVSTPSPLSTAGEMVCAITGATTARPVSGEAEECPGTELPKLEDNCAVPTEPLASAPALSAIVGESADPRTVCPALRSVGL